LLNFDGLVKIRKFDCRHQCVGIALFAIPTIFTNEIQDISHGMAKSAGQGERE